uniref:Transposase (Putative), gypsy type n=1 Tax=Tanacetum cinerariifolium TaxID=118510 RepID=A0A6L2L9E2_TANCI|nr:hypothetical protein [Tanacetum cinerariifolium]
MSAITDIRCVLTQKALDALCDKFHIPEEVHPVLPKQNDTMHEKPAGKIRLCTRFFDYANFRLPLSTFLVDVLRHFHINISQLFVIGAAKSGWMSFSKHSDNAPVCYTKPLDSLKNWNNHFFWVDDFVCPASFPWHTAKHVTRDPDPAAADFNAQDYTTLVAYPSSFWKFLETFMCLVGLSRHYTLDEETYPRFLHKNEEGGNRYFCFHPYPKSYQIAPDCADSELEASVERLFDEGGSGTQTEQGDSTKGGLDVNIQPVVKAANTVLEDAAPMQARRQGKKICGGKFRSALQRLLARAMLNAKVGVAAIPTLPFVTASVSSTSEREDEDHTDSAEVDSLVRSSAHMMTTATAFTSMVDCALVAKEKPVKPSLFSVDSSSASGADPNTGVFLDLTGSDFLVGGIHTIIDPDTDLQKVRMRVEYNIKERRRLKSIVEKQDELLKARDGEIENLKAQLLLKEMEATKATRLRAQTSNLEAVEKFFRDEVNTLKERNIILEKERNALDLKVTDLEALVVGKERDLIDLNAQLTFVKSQNDNLADRISSAGLQEKITVYDNCMEQLEKFQDDRMKVVNDKLAKLDSDLTEMACHLEENFYPYLLNTISDQRWLLTHGLKLFLIKCLNSSTYLTALGAAISRAIKKGMQSGLTADIDHGREGKSLANVAAYNPDAKADFNSALQNFREVDFHLLAEIKSHKDASTEDIMNVLCLEDALVDAPGMNDLQPDIEQENIASQRSAFIGVWTPLSKPLSIASLMGEACTSGVVPAASVSITALSTTFASASSIPPISIDDYEIVSVDGQEGAGTDGRAVVDGNVAPFLNVDDVQLNIP